MNVAGYFKGVMGTGEHARQLVEALRAQGVPVSTTTLRPEGSPEDEELGEDVARLERSGRAAENPFAAFNLLCANAEMVPAVAGQLGEEFFAGRYTIGFWAWEVASFPRRFLAAFGHVDEVWVGSRHVRAAVTAAASVPVVAIPQPVSMAALPTDSGSFELPDGFRFLFAFDYLSVFERKNPLATIEAFKRAFQPGEAALIVKTLNEDFNPAAHELVRAAAASHPDVHLLERRLSRFERDGLMNAADCYVSLHRAEGFGYTLAEAMWLGKPVIGTGYSGNLDFMSDRNSYLVDYRMVPTGPGHDPYPSEGEWAEPDIDHAARLMREVFDHREEAARRGARAAGDIRGSHRPQVAGQVMRERLELLSSSQAARTASARRREAVATQRAAELITSGPVPPGRPRFGAPQRLARNALLRLFKPVTVHERLVAAELLTAIERLDRRLAELESELQSLDRRAPD